MKIALACFGEKRYDSATFADDDVFIRCYGELLYVSILAVASMSK
jgi:hypothetical protein